MDLETLKELLTSLNINPDEIEDERYATAFRILFAIEYTLHTYRIRARYI